MNIFSAGKRLRLIVCFLFLFSICHLSLFAQEPVISRVSVSQKVIDLSKKENVSIHYFISAEARISLSIFDESNRLVRKIEEKEVVKAGKHTLTWDGQNEEKKLAGSGVYFYVLEANGQTNYVHDLREKTGGQEVLVEKLTWDIPKGIVHYLLPKAGYVRIRVGIKEGTLLGTLLDWTAMDAGEKEFPWKGLDPSGYFDLSKNPAAQVNIAAFALPDNAVIVKSEVVKSSLRGNVPDGAEAISESKAASSDGFQRRSHNDDSVTKYIHAGHPRELCHEPNFQVEFPGVPIDPKSKTPILKGKTPVRISLDSKAQSYLESNRFEVMFSVDTVFLFEQEEGINPMTIELDSKQLGKGEHLLTINVMDYEDHIAVKTVKIMVGNDAPPQPSPLIKNGEGALSPPFVSNGGDKEGESRRKNA